MNRANQHHIVADNYSSPGSSGDCDCACPTALPLRRSALLPAGAPIERHPEARSVPLAGDYHVAFVPSLSRVAALNASALQLLDSLALPRPLDALSPDDADAARALLDLGLARPAGESDPAPADPDELVAWLHVTNACNLRCTYCYLQKTEEAMDEQTAFAAVDAVLRSAVRHGYRNVHLKYAGGEASLNLPLVQKTHCYARDRCAAEGIALGGVVLSNGVGLTHYKLELIRHLGLRLMISLDGIGEDHDRQRPTVAGGPSFRAAAGSIARAHALGLPLTVSVTVTGASVGGLPAVMTWLLDEGIHFSLNFVREHMYNAGYAELRLDEQRLIDGLLAAYRVLEGRWPRYSLLGCLVDRANLGVAHSRTCAVGENYLVVDQRGQVAKCQMTIEEPLTSVWADDPLLTIRLDPVGVQNLAVSEKEGCRDCEWRFWCTGGCPVSTFRATGRYDIHSPSCTIYKTIYPRIVELEGARLLHWAHEYTVHRNVLMALPSAVG